MLMPLTKQNLLQIRNSSYQKLLLKVVKDATTKVVIKIHY